MLVVAGLLGSCSLGAKQQQADQVIDAVRRTVASGPLSGSVTASLSLPKSKFNQGVSALGLPGGFSARFIVDGKAGRSQLAKTSDTKKGSFLAVLFDDEQIYAHRPDALENEARAWYQLKLDDLGKSSGALTPTAVIEGAPAEVLAVLDPRFVLDLGAGALAGSMHTIGAEKVGRSSTTHYRANFDIPTMLKDTRHSAYSDARRERQERILHLLKITGEVHKGEVWITPAGSVRKLKFVLRINLDRLTNFDITIEMTLDDTAAAIALTAPPGADETIIVSNLVPIERTAASMTPANPLAAAGAKLTGGGGG